MMDSRRRQGLFFLLLIIGFVMGLSAVVYFANRSSASQPHIHPRGNQQRILSSDYATQAQKIATLKNHLDLPGNELAVEFTLDEMSNLLASTYHYKIAVKVPSSEIDHWLKSITTVPWAQGKDHSDLHEGIQLQLFNYPQGNPTWKHHSKPEYYHSVESMKTDNAAIVYRPEGIILLTIDHHSI